LSLCLTNEALRHEGVWVSGGIDPLVGGEWTASREGRFTAGERPPGTHCIGGWVGPRAGLDRLDDVEKRKFLSLSGLELRPLGRPASRYTDCAIPAPSLYKIRGKSLTRISSFRKTLTYLQARLKMDIVYFI
jgi:hypothetical protein